MQMSRKTWVSLVLIAALMIASVGCSSSQPASTAKDSGKIPLTLWYWNRSIDDNLLKEVGKQFPNIDLKAEKKSAATSKPN